MTNRKPHLQTPEQLREHAGKACALLKTLANEDRLLLLCQIASERLNVGELEAITGIRQPPCRSNWPCCGRKTWSIPRRRGKFVYYRLANDNVMRVMRTLWDIYCAPK